MNKRFGVSNWEATLGRLSNPQSDLYPLHPGVHMSINHGKEERRCFLALSGPDLGVAKETTGDGHCLV